MADLDLTIAGMMKARDAKLACNIIIATHTGIIKTTVKIVTIQLQLNASKKEITFQLPLLQQCTCSTSTANRHVFHTS